jgi:hypothetical protein
MLQDFEQIEYRQGMLEKKMKPESLLARIWHGSEIPVEVLKAIESESLLKLGGTYGNKNAGDPIEYDNLKLVMTDAIVEITVFNRGITLFMSDDERIRRIHRVLCTIDKSEKD